MVMEIGCMIRRLRNQKGISQESFSNEIGVSVQTVSRWENNVNYPDLSMLPILASYFKVTTDYLLGVKGGPRMAKLLKTVETFEVSGKDEAEKMVAEFKASAFPKLLSYRIDEEGGRVILETVKEFGMELDDMKFD